MNPRPEAHVEGLPALEQPEVDVPRGVWPHLQRLVGVYPPLDGVRLQPELGAHRRGRQGYGEAAPEEGDEDHSSLQYTHGGGFQGTLKANYTALHSTNTPLPP